MSRIGSKLGLDLKIINASVTSNIDRKNSLVNRVINFSKDKNLEGKTVSLLGLTFKANIDDTRYLPAINLVEEVTKKNVKINAYEPYGIVKCKWMVDKKDLEFVTFFNDDYEAIKGTELLIIITECEEFKKIDYQKIYNMIVQKVVVDFRSILNE